MQKDSIMVKHIILWKLKEELTLESPEALKGYAKHPAHVAIADTKVRPFTAARTCLDFEI